MNETKNNERRDRERVEQGRDEEERGQCEQKNKTRESVWASEWMSNSKSRRKKVLESCQRGTTAILHSSCCSIAFWLLESGILLEVFIPVKLQQKTACYKEHFKAFNPSSAQTVTVKGLKFHSVFTGNATDSKCLYTRFIRDYWISAPCFGEWFQDCNLLTRLGKKNINLVWTLHLNIHSQVICAIQWTLHRGKSRAYLGQVQ